MKNIEYYLKLPYHLEIMPDIYEGGYVASYPELPGCLTCADTLEEVITNALDAKKRNNKVRRGLSLQVVCFRISLSQDLVSLRL